MKKKIVTSASFLFWFSLYFISAYFYYTEFLAKDSEIAIAHLTVPFMAIFIAGFWFTGANKTDSMKYRISLIYLATLIFPLWWAPFGVVWVIIKLIKYAIIGIKIIDWEIKFID